MTTIENAAEAASYEPDLLGKVILHIRPLPRWSRVVSDGLDAPQSSWPGWRRALL